MTAPSTITGGGRRHQETVEPLHPVVRLLPATEADEDDMAYYRDRLEDLALLDAGAVVLIRGVRLLAVPVGGIRRGGFLPTGDVVTGLAVRAALAGRPGFPNVRLRWSADLEVCHSVGWGERPPQWDDIERGRFYGYRAEAIARYLAWLQTPRRPDRDPCTDDLRRNRTPGRASARGTDAADRGRRRCVVIERTCPYWAV